MDQLNNIEVEITLPLKNPGDLIKQLDVIAKLDRKNLYQKDTYYIPPHKNFLKQKPVSDWLRIRETGRGATINFKHWHNKGNKQAVSADEYETAINNVDSIKKIFQALDIREIVVVEKQRSTWIYKNVEIALDNVTDLGWFIELEAKGKFASVEEATKHLYKILKELKAQTGQQDYKGYPYLLLEKKGKV